MTSMQRERDLGTWVDDGSMTVAAWLNHWLEENSERRSVKTMANYRGHVRDLWKAALGHLKLRDVRRHHIEGALISLNRAKPADRRGKFGRRVTRRSAATIDGYRRTIRAALGAAQRRGLMAVNPAAGRLDAIPDRSSTTLSIWEPEDTAQFLEHLRSDRLAALYELAAYEGLRRAELCGLRWSDLDHDGAGLVVRQTIVEAASNNIAPMNRVCRCCGREHRSLLVKSPKSRAGNRWVPLVAAARDALQARRHALDVEREACGAAYSDHGLIFCQINGDPLRPSAVTAQFEAHVKACGLPSIRLHDTRHGACSLLLAGGVPIEVVQMILGHSSPAVTRLVYAHVMKKATAAQVEAAADLINRHRRGQSADKIAIMTDGSEGGVAMK